MLLSFGVSIQGSSHQEKDIVCQDAHVFKILKNGWVVSAVADGVGSAKHSDIASRIAVDSVIEYVESKKLPTRKQGLLDILKESFQLALDKIYRTLKKQKHKEIDYDTTLHAVIYNGETIVYGHSGDGGIVGLSYDGEYVAITKPQKGSDGNSVIPLRAGAETWQFGTSSKSFSAILLATDGVYDTFFPYLLRGQKNEIYVPLIRCFMDNPDVRTQDALGELLCSDKYKGVTDDMTAVVIINKKVKPLKRDKDYYAMPNWDALKEEWNKKAYPHLYNNEDKE